MKSKKKKPTPPAEAVRRAKIARLRERLKDMQDYKALIAADGLVPDEEDKRLESELIVKLLRLEKAGKDPGAKGKSPRGQAGMGKGTGRGAPPLQKSPRNAGRQGARPPQSGRRSRGRG